MSGPSACVSEGGEIKFQLFTSLKAIYRATAVYPIPPQNEGSSICITYKETLVQQRGRHQTITLHCKTDQVSREQFHVK